jgi:hypothetical protein
MKKVLTEIGIGIVILVLFIGVSMIVQLPFGSSGIDQLSGGKLLTYQIGMWGTGFLVTILLSFIASRYLKPLTALEILREGLVWGTVMVVYGLVIAYMNNDINAGINFGTFLALAGLMLGPMISAKTKHLI